MYPDKAALIIQQSAGPIRWMPSGSPHRALINGTIIIAAGNGIVELDGRESSIWLNTTLQHATFCDPVIADLSARYPYLRPLTDGGLWEGLMTSITGQAVSLHSAAAFQRRLCAMLSPELKARERSFWALPPADAVAECPIDLIRGIGLTTKRAQGLVSVAQDFAAGKVGEPAMDDVEGWMHDLTRLPMVGPWTAASALLWGIGHPDVYPKGDVALLRAARYAYNDATLTMRQLDVLAEGWRPQRAIAARLLWTNLLGMGWDTE